MVTGTVAWYIEQEARAMLTRLALVKPFAVHETMVPAATPAPAALAAIESFLILGRQDLTDRIKSYLDWLVGPGRSVPAQVAQRRFTLLRMDFNNVLTQFDLFTEVITQRSEHITGVWLSGLDVLAQDTLALRANTLNAPPVVCYLARGPGAAIRRAHTGLPGGVENPAAVIRIPRERMVGHGIASSLVHEVGHQAAALLSLVESLRPMLSRHGADADADLWNHWHGWISEIVADLWSVAKLGIASTLGLMAVVSLPRWAVFRPSGPDPHPIPWIRVHVSAAIGDALYPDPQWAKVTRLWRDLYPISGLTTDYAKLLRRLLAHLPAFAAALLSHRAPALGGSTLQEALVMPERRPERLMDVWRGWQGRGKAPQEWPPSLAFAAIGQARAAGLVTPERESVLVGELLTQHALASSLDVSQICAAHTHRAWPAALGRLRCGLN
jgi:hypothetical protein